MNDNIREKLSAYIDGSLTDTERRGVEVEISRSEEMRLELEALRAVSDAVKRLPREKLPAGFMARLEARRARDSESGRGYFILPPAYRPLAFVLSAAVVALVVWDRTHETTEFVDPKVGWDGDRIAVKSAAEAPPSIDVSGRLSSTGSSGQAVSGQASSVAADDVQSQNAKKEGDSASTFGKHISAPGKPLEIAEEKAAAPTPAAVAAPAIATDKVATAEGTGSFSARNEEERSAINERLYQALEKEKKRMGIAKILDKDADEKNVPIAGGQAASVRGAPRRSAPSARAITLRSVEALQAAWTAAGIPGEPPTIDFSSQMAIFLAGPQGCGITSIQNRKKFIVVLYKNTGFDDAAARVRAVTPSPKPVVIKLEQ